MKSKIFKYSVVFLCCALMLAGCGGTPAGEPAAEEPAPTEEAVVATEQEPTPTPKAPIPCRIVYDSEGDNNRDVFVMEPDGSNQTNLSNHPANDFDPVWSPDGEAIAFLSDRENEQGEGRFVYVMKADGSGVKQLSTMPDSAWPDWSPAGSQIAFGHDGDIFVINTDGSGETNLTNSEDRDEHPKFSPDGQQIAWKKSSGDGSFIYVMNADGSDPKQVTTGGEIHDLEWTVDGRIFTHWSHPEGLCGNCVVSADGSGVMDAGGKGSIQEFLPFWTVDSERVEMISAQVPFIGGEDDEIYLVGDIFPDIFLNLTDNDVQDGNADAPAFCGPGEAGAITEETQPEAAQTAGSGEMVIGYAIRSDNPFKEEQILKACGELQVTCVRGENITQLSDQNVSAIVYVSNRWDVLGSFPEIWEAREKFIPLFIVDAETSLEGVYNLSVESDSVQVSFEWMFKQMDGAGEIVIYNLGNNDLHQELIEANLEQFPGIQATFLPSDFGNPGYNEESIAQMVRENPNLGAIWSNGDTNAIFWGIHNAGAGNQRPLFICPNREDFLNAWKEASDEDAGLRGISTIAPGGAAYEGVYVAYYVLNGAEINPEMLTGAYSNTLRYDFPVITNENLAEWLGKLDTLQVGQWDALEMPAMTPEQIRQMWFLD
jgi:TolB protein